ncbi:MAG: soluble lytic murein transglycosylase [Bacteriovoracaceae bacterium]|jgi:soluble lytic murein transglycosylase
MSCSSTSLTSPPDQEDMKAIANKLNKITSFEAPENHDNSSYALAFLKANDLARKGLNKEACPYYKFLSMNEVFVLQKLAWVRALGTCTYSKDQLIKIWDREDLIIPKWLDEEYVNTSYATSKKYNLRKYEAIFISKRSRYEKIKKERLKLLKNAHKISKTVGDSELEEELLTKIHRLAPRLMRDIQQDDRYKVGRDFENIRDFDRARMFYRKIIRDPSVNLKTKKMAWNRLRLSYKLQRQKPTYVHKTLKMVNFFKKKLIDNPKDKRIKRIWVNTSIKYSRALWTLHQRDEGRAVLKKLLAYGVEDKEPLVQIHWILGKMKAEEKLFEDAIKRFEKASELKTSNQNFKERIAWSLGWNYYLLNQFQNTIDYFNKYMDENEDSRFNLKLKFWMARSYLKLGKEGRSKKILAQIAKDDPYGYYGIISNIELKKSFSPLKVKKRKKHYYDSTLEWLLSLGEIKLGENYLKSIQRKFKSKDQITQLLPLYEKIGWYEGGIFKFFRIKSSERNSVLEDHISSAFPIPYQDKFISAGKKYNIEPGILFSISRQESAFNPVIRSAADAFGLMQLIPERAKELAVRHNINYKVLEDLYNPEINISLGAALLSDLKTKFKNNFIHFVASYNASESAVNNWFRRYWKDDPYQFIETIPYEETQKYVKLVFRNFVTYKRMLSNDDFEMSSKVFTDLDSIGKP